MEYKRKDYQEKYEDFWKDIVENEDGTLNKDQVMRELSDYSMVMDNCARAYYHMTNGKISKQNTCFYEVLNVFDELFLDKEVVVEDISQLIQNNNLEELRNELKDYFGIEGDNNG